jgi:hypothetical protein
MSTVAELSPRCHTSRPLLVRIFSFLVERHQRERGRGTSVDRIFQAGWPNDRASASSAANRVYVAMNALRKLGLGDLIARDHDGYRLDPSLEVRLDVGGAPTGTSRND